MVSGRAGSAGRSEVQRDQPWGGGRRRGRVAQERVQESMERGGWFWNSGQSYGVLPR